MEIEQLAVERPEALARVPVDAITGVDRAKADEIVAQARIPAAVADQAAEVVVKLWETFVGEDATLVEVNPLVRDPQDRVVALDGKVTLDDNADFRHPGHADLVDERTENPLEAKAKAKEPQLRQARRRSGRHHRQRRGPGDVDPRRRRVRRASGTAG